jgi:putative DNA methylase
MSKAETNSSHPILPFPGSELPAPPVEKPRKRKSAAADSILDDNLPPNLGKPLVVKIPDFSDPNRPKTCLEVDFPIAPLNLVARRECVAGSTRKPIYQSMKWWARRVGSVFRCTLLAAAMEAPIRRHHDGQPMLGPDGKPLIDEDVADQVVWDAYYANHQAAGNFKHLKVLDPFMGGGTTLVEGSRLGFQVVGVDLNPVAWFIVKNELACTDPKEVKALFDQIEAEVKPQIQPFYVTNGVGGRKGTWYKIIADGGRETMPTAFDPVTLPPDERKGYQYEGPEVIYTFWAKHGPCSNLTCGHRTPIFRSPIVAIKRLGVKYIPCTCKNKQCGITFHAELGDARIAPDAEQVVLEGEHPYTVVSPGFAKRLLDYGKGDKGDKTFRIHELSDTVETEAGFNCPRCGTWSGQTVRDVLAMHRHAIRVADIDKKHFGILPVRNGKKPVYCTLLIDPEWFKGSPGKTADGMEFGGYCEAPIDHTHAWYRERLKNLRLIEVRGNVSGVDADEQDASAETDAGNDGPAEEQSEKSWIPPTVTLHDGRTIDTRAETIARTANGKENEGHFVCAAPGGGHQMHFAKSVQATRRTSPVAPYAIQVYDRQRDEEGYPYGGRFFKAPDETDIERMIAAEQEWNIRKDADLDGHWPREEIPFTYMTHQANFALPEQGYTHWYRLFNARQILTLGSLLKAVSGRVTSDVGRQALGAFQYYLRTHNMLSFWNIAQDCLEPSFGNPNYNSKPLTVEGIPFGEWGRNNWTTCTANILAGLDYAADAWDWVVETDGSKAIAARSGDRVSANQSLLMCRSSTDLAPVDSRSIDLIVTDPPFGDNIYYSDLSNFFYAWLRQPLQGIEPDLFGPTKTPNAQEALKPRWLTDTDGDQYYYDRLAPCWVECRRIMKDGGLLAFTFHHSEPAQWEIVLRSLFEAGFYLEAAYPIASDEMKGKGGQFGAKGTEYDIIHVCRKRIDDPKPVSWPKMRQWVKAELARLRPLLERRRSRDLRDSDIHLILMGKALEFFSKHYGKVLISVPGGEETVLSIRDALEGIRQLLDEGSTQPGERPPSIVQPIVYEYLRIFGTRCSYNRNEVSMLLRSTRFQPRDFEHAGSTPWIVEQDKIITRVPIYGRFQKMRQRSRRELKTELDQAHFLIGAAMPVKEGDSGVNIETELERATFLIRPGVEALLDWYTKTPAGTDEPGVPKAAGIALQLLRAAFEAHRARIAIEQPWLNEEWKASVETIV